MTEVASGEIQQISQGEIKRLDSIVAQFLGAIRPHKPQLELTSVNELVEDGASRYDAQRQATIEFEETQKSLAETLFT